MKDVNSDKLLPRIRASPSSSRNAFSIPTMADLRPPPVLLLLGNESLPGWLLLEEIHPGLLLIVSLLEVPSLPAHKKKKKRVQNQCGRAFKKRSKTQNFFSPKIRQPTIKYLPSSKSLPN